MPVWENWYVPTCVGLEISWTEIKCIRWWSKRDSSHWKAPKSFCSEQVRVTVGGKTPPTPSPPLCGRAGRACSHHQGARPTYFSRSGGRLRCVRFSHPRGRRSLQSPDDPSRHFSTSRRQHSTTFERVGQKTKSVNLDITSHHTVRTREMKLYVV